MLHKSKFAVSTSVLIRVHYNVKWDAQNEFNTSRQTLFTLLDILNKLR